MSNQAVVTPKEFLEAVERRFGRIGFDLAAHRGNRVVPDYFGPGSPLGEDALEEDWDALGARAELLWLNPPFKTIAPWAEKAAASGNVTIAMLALASVCTGWFLDHVKSNAYVFELTPRVFKVEICDCILAMFTPEGYVGRETWKWR